MIEDQHSLYTETKLSRSGLGLKWTEGESKAAYNCNTFVLPWVNKKDFD